MNTNSTILEYVWFDGNNNLRSKTRVLYNNLTLLSEIPEWNYDGSSCGQANTDKSEILLIPKKLYKDPFRKNYNAFLVLCESMRNVNNNLIPVKGNNRYNAELTLNKAKEHEPWFGFELEFYLYDTKTRLPLGFSSNGVPPVQGDFYCSVGSLHANGRDFMEEQLKCCLYANINITGYNLEVASGQLEYQVFGHGMNAPDDCWMSRYILNRLCEKFNYYVNFDPKPFIGDVNGSGLHTNFSTKSTRDKNGIDSILSMMDKLDRKHEEHINVYGKNNHLRLTGSHETSSIKSFSYGVANRTTSVRIPTETYNNGYGYFEDRRPASNADYWNIAEILVKTTCL